jgi:hypothetical protein
LLTNKTEVASEPIRLKYKLLVQILNFVKKGIVHPQICYHIRELPLLTLSRVINAAAKQ